MHLEQAQLGATGILGTTFLPAKTQRASRSTALVSRNPLSMRRASSLAFSVGLPGSKLGEPIGLNSTLNRREPSFGLSKNKGLLSACAWIVMAKAPCHRTLGRPYCLFRAMMNLQQAEESSLARARCVIKRTHTNAA